MRLISETKVLVIKYGTHPLEAAGINNLDNSQNKCKRFVYFYFNQNEPVKIQQVVPSHVQYWKSANLEENIGGNFGDRMGGLISFAAPSLQEAAEIIYQGPFILNDLVAQKWVKEWLTG